MPEWILGYPSGLNDAATEDAGIDLIKDARLTGGGTYASGDSLAETKDGWSEATTNWVSTGAGTDEAVSLDTTVFKVGAGSIATTRDATGAITLTQTPGASIDLSDYSHIHIWVQGDGTSEKVDFIRIESDAGVKYWTEGTDVTLADSSWTKISYALPNAEDDMVWTKTSTPDITAITTIIIGFTNPTDSSGEVRVDAPYFNKGFSFAEETPVEDNFKIVAIDYNVTNTGKTTIITNLQNTEVGGWAIDDFNKGTLINKMVSAEDRVGNVAEVEDIQIATNKYTVILDGDESANFGQYDSCTIHNGESAVQFDTDIVQLNPERIDQVWTNKDQSTRMPYYDSPIAVPVGREPDVMDFIMRFKQDDSNSAKYYFKIFKRQALKKLDYQGQNADGTGNDICPQVLKIPDSTSGLQEYSILWINKVRRLRDAPVGENIIEAVITGNGYWVV